MIHVRLNEDEHRRLRVVIAEKRTTIQRFVSELVKRELDARHVK